MELQEREKEVLCCYTFRIGYCSKTERIEMRDAITEDFNTLLDENKISIEEYNTMHEELDKLDKEQ